MIIVIAFILAFYCLVLLLFWGSPGRDAYWTQGRGRFWLALLCGVLAQVLIVTMLPGFVFACVAATFGANSGAVFQTNMLACNTLIYGHLFYYLLGRQHARHPRRP
ncbi:MAG TPA: hypothetical protein VF546_24740 [Pyrinomonadaceae bacterium]